MRVCQSPEHLAYPCNPEGRAEFPDDEATAAVAERVGREHSFTARAETLLDAAVESLARRGELCAG